MRRAIAGISLVAFLAAVVGVPMPVSTIPAGAVKHSGEDYPCRDHACGCLNAEMCRTQCCCGHSAKAAVARPATGGCCASGEDATCSRNEAPATKRVGLAINALGCTGVNLSWVSCGVVLERPGASALLDGPVVIDEFSSDAISPPASRSLKPSIPPPRA